MKKKESKNEMNELRTSLRAFFGSVQKIQEENQKGKKNPKPTDGNAENTK
jgi:hypothetical protein